MPKVYYKEMTYVKNGTPCPIIFDLVNVEAGEYIANSYYDNGVEIPFPNDTPEADTFFQMVITSEDSDGTIKLKEIDITPFILLGVIEFKPNGAGGKKIILNPDNLAFASKSVLGVTLFKYELPKSTPVIAQSNHSNNNSTIMTLNTMASRNAQTLSRTHHGQNLKSLNKNTNTENLNATASIEQKKEYKISMDYILASNPEFGSYKKEEQSLTNPGGNFENELGRKKSQPIILRRDLNWCVRMQKYNENLKYLKERYSIIEEYIFPLLNRVLQDIFQSEDIVRCKIHYQTIMKKLKQATIAAFQGNHDLFKFDNLPPLLQQHMQSNSDVAPVTAKVLYEGYIAMLQTNKEKVLQANGGEIDNFKLENEAIMIEIESAADQESVKENFEGYCDLDELLHSLLETTFQNSINASDKSKAKPKRSRCLTEDQKAANTFNDTKTMVINILIKIEAQGNDSFLGGKTAEELSKRNALYFKRDDNFGELLRKLREGNVPLNKTGTVTEDGFTNSSIIESCNLFPLETIPYQKRTDPTTFLSTSFRIDKKVTGTPSEATTSKEKETDKKVIINSVSRDLTKDAFISWMSAVTAASEGKISPHIVKLTLGEESQVRGRSLSRAAQSFKMTLSTFSSNLLKSDSTKSKKNEDRSSSSSSSSFHFSRSNNN